MKNKKSFLISSLLVSSLFLSVGCTSNENTTDTTNKDNTVSEKNTSMERPSDEKASFLYGKVSSVSDNEITLNVGTLNIKKKPNNNDNTKSPEDLNNKEKPEGDMKGKPNDSGEKLEPPINGEKPQGEPQVDVNGEPNNNGERPEFPSDGEKPKMNEDSKKLDIFVDSGEEKTIAITNDIKIIKINRAKPNEDKSNEHIEETLSISDISVGDILMIKYKEDNTTIDYIQLMPTRPMNNNQEKSIKKDTSK